MTIKRSYNRMEKTIYIGDKEVRLNNNIGWAIDYRDQFGQDIIPTLLPMVAAGLDLIKGILEQIDGADSIDWRDVLQVLDGDVLLDAMVHLGGLEFKDFINVTWALAKNADESIPEPRQWVRQFDAFPVDVIAPAVFELVMKGIVSSKNLKRLREIKESLPPQPKKAGQA